MTSRQVHVVQGLFALGALLGFVLTLVAPFTQVRFMAFAALACGLAGYALQFALLRQVEGEEAPTMGRRLARVPVTSYRIEPAARPEPGTRARLEPTVDLHT